MARRQSEDRGRRGYHVRTTGQRELRQRFLIVCEGSKTEPNYFNAFRAAKEIIDVEVLGLGLDPLTLVQEAIRRSGEAKRAKAPYDQVWCVFDRDDWPVQMFSQAIELVRNKGLRVAYSNEAFELWYLLHFDYHDTAISRSTYQRRLTERLGFAYRKNNPEMYRVLFTHQAIAIQFATKLLAQYDPPNPANDNPSTTVHLLVQELNKHARP